jgi:hypothetical protein
MERCEDCCADIQANVGYKEPPQVMLKLCML